VNIKFTPEKILNYTKTETGPPRFNFREPVPKLLLSCFLLFRGINTLTEYVVILSLGDITTAYANLKL